MYTSGELVHFDKRKLAVRQLSQGRHALPWPPRLEDGSVYISMLYNRNNLTELSKWCLVILRPCYIMQNWDASPGRIDCS